MVRVRYSFSSRRTGKIKNMRKQRKKFSSIVHEVLRVSDVILEVLDARFIEETRNIEIENEIKKMGKSIIYILNKADLVNEEEIAKTLKIRPYVFISCTKREGSARLRNLIKRIVAGIDLPDNKERAQVGVIGYPNTGKSSLLNILTGRSSAKTGNEAGFTKGVQKVRLTKDILILDTPGVISNSDYSMSDKDKVAKHTKVGSRSFSRVRNPDLVIQKLLDDPFSRVLLEKYYGFECESDAEIFLETLGKKKSFLKKGGIIDIDRTARDVLHEWQDGKIK